MKIIGKKIKEARHKKGITQEELAELSKMNLRTIQRIENEENSPRGKSLKLICEVLDINIDDLFKREKDERKNILIKRIINGIFLTILNFVLITIFGYLTIDSNANTQSKLASLLLSFLIPIFIIVKTQRMKGIERMIKFGIGLFAYTIVISTKISFPSLFITGLLPSLIIVLGTLNYGRELLNLNE